MKYIIQVIFSYSLALVLISLFSTVSTAGVIVGAYTVMFFALIQSYFESKE